MREAASMSATRPVEGPSAGTATQLVEAPGAGPEVLLSGPAVLCRLTVRKICKMSLAPQTKMFLVTKNSLRKLVTETIRGVRSFIRWHKIPEFDSVSFLDDNPFAGSRVQPSGKVSVKLPVDDWLYRKKEKLNLTITEGYPSRNTETAGLLRDQFVEPPRSSRWYDMHADKDSDVSTVCSWSPELAKLNSAFSRVARRSLPAAHTPGPLGHFVRCWERTAREQTVMCNQVASLSRCLTRVQCLHNSRVCTW